MPHATAVRHKRGGFTYTLVGEDVTPQRVLYRTRVDGYASHAAERDARIDAALI